MKEVFRRRRRRCKRSNRLEPELLAVVKRLALLFLPLSLLIGGQLASAQVKVGFAAIDLSDGRIVKAQNADLPLKPASVQKVLLSGAALKALGPEYQFETKVYGDLRVGKIKDLVIRGSAAPDLTTEQLWRMVRALKFRGVESVTNIWLDDSMAAQAKPRTGPEAFEAGSNALSLNFNSIEFRLCPGKAGQAARVAFDPWEAEARQEGVIKTIEGNAGAAGIEAVEGEKGAIVFKKTGEIGADALCDSGYRSVEEPLVYFAAVLRGFLKEQHITLSGKIQAGAGPQVQPPLLYTHPSKPLRLVLNDLNHFSTNSIAEQLLLALGKDLSGVMDRERGLVHLTSYAQSLGFEEGRSFHFVDGSGLSHENRASALLIVRALSEVYHNPQVREEFLSSLSVAGKSGTLRDRAYDISPAVLRAKTGTLDGVLALAGYLTGEHGSRFAFAILQNDVTSREDALHAEKDLIQALHGGASQ